MSPGLRAVGRCADCMSVSATCDALKEREIPSPASAAFATRVDRAEYRGLTQLLCHGGLANRENSAVAPTLALRVAKRCAGQPARWLAGCLPARSLAGFRASCAPRLASWSYPPNRIGYPNSDSQYSLVVRLLSVVLPRPDSALSSSAGHDSESPYWLEHYTSAMIQSSAVG